MARVGDSEGLRRLCVLRHAPCPALRRRRGAFHGTLAFASVLRPELANREACAAARAPRAAITAAARAAPDPRGAATCDLGVISTITPRHVSLSRVTRTPTAARCV